MHSGLPRAAGILPTIIPHGPERGYGRAAARSRPARRGHRPGLESRPALRSTARGRPPSRAGRVGRRTLLAGLRDRPRLRSASATVPERLLRGVDAPGSGRAARDPQGSGVRRRAGTRGPRGSPRARSISTSSSTRTRLCRLRASRSRTPRCRSAPSCSCPWSEIAGAWRHPALRRTISELAATVDPVGIQVTHLRLREAREAHEP